MAEKFNDRAIPASVRYPDKPTPAPVNFDMGRHVDDRVERCQEDYQRDFGDEHEDPYERLAAERRLLTTEQKLAQLLEFLDA